MNDFFEDRLIRQRWLFPFAVALALLLATAGVPGASVHSSHGVSNSGAPDILLLNGPSRQAVLASDFQTGQVVAEIRQRALTESVQKVLSRYPRFIDEDEQDRLAGLLIQEGARQGIDPLFLAALIRVESAFSEDAISNKGARGLMQLMPATGEEMALRLGLDWQGPGNLHDPEYNLRLGAYYLRNLLDHYRGDVRQALTAYNRGPRNVRYLVKRHGGLQRRYTGYFRRIQTVYREYQRSLDASAALLKIG